MAMNKSNITRPLVVVIVALVAALAIPTAASAAGACGGGMTFNQMYNGWKKKGVLDDVYRSAGIKPGVDAAKGKASKALLKKAFTRKRVVRGTSRARNSDCRGGRFDRLKKRARQSSGTYVWVLKDDILKGGVVKNWWAADCGNKRGGWIKVHMPGKKPPKKTPKTPPPTVIPPPSSGGCTIIIGGDNNGNVGCNSVFVCTANGQYNNNQGLCSAYANCIAVQGNTWNSTQNVCTSPPPPPSDDCPPGTIGSYPDCEWPGPSAQIDAGPAHFIVSTTGFIYARARAGEGRNLTSVTVSVTAGHTSGLVPSTTYDGATCPTGWSCFRTQYWAPPYTVLAPSFVTATVTATQDDGQWLSNETKFEIKPDSGFNN